MSACPRCDTDTTNGDLCDQCITVLEGAPTLGTSPSPDTLIVLHVQNLMAELGRTSKFNTWERGFLASILRLSKGNPHTFTFTTRQRESIHKIEHKCLYLLKRLPSAHTHTGA